MVRASHPIVITETAIRSFSVASHDTNPLHLDEAYARTTQFGRPIAFGILGALACLGRLAIPPGKRVRQLTVDFAGPIFIGPAYQINILQLGSDRLGANLSDGSRVLLNLTVRTTDGTRDREMPAGAAFPLRSEPARRTAKDFAEPFSVTGRYTLEPDDLVALCRALTVEPGDVSPALYGTLLWSSWLVGMEVPGRQALFNGLSLEFTPPASFRNGFDFTAQVRGFNPRFGLIRTAFALSSAGETFAKGEVRSFIRKEAEPATDPELLRWIGAHDLLARKVVLVIGASRGLGAHLSRALVLQGATVYANYLRSEESFTRLREGLGDAKDRLIDAQGDGANPDWCARTVERIVAEQGRLDTLVCNACPTILPMAYEAASAAKVHEYISQAIALASYPLAASLEALSASEGRAVVISSVYAEKTPPNFPHYVAAKCAIEGLVRAAAGHHRKIGFILVRPPRLEGELSIPFAGDNVLPAAQVAAKIALAIGELHPHGTVRWL